MNAVTSYTDDRFPGLVLREAYKRDEAAGYDRHCMEVWQDAQLLRTVFTTEASRGFAAGYFEALASAAEQ